MQVTTGVMEVGTSLGQLNVLHLIPLGRGNLNYIVMFKVQKVQFQSKTIRINGINLVQNVNTMELRILIQECRQRNRRRQGVT
jgi:hypothetical protein